MLASESVELAESWSPTAKEGGGAPLPAGLATPGPAVRVEAMPPGALFPSLALGSAGGGDSAETETIWAPRTMMRPRVRFSSVSITWTTGFAPGAAAGLVCLRLTRRNSSVSASTRFMCCITSQLSASNSCLSVCATHLVKGKHLAGHLAAVIENDAHPPVDLTRGGSAVARDSLAQSAASRIGGRARTKPIWRRTEIISIFAEASLGETYHFPLLVRHLGRLKLCELLRCSFWKA